MPAGLQIKAPGDTLGNVVDVSATNPLPISSTVGGSAVSNSNPSPTASTPTAVAGNAIVPVTAVNATSLVVKASPGNLYSGSMVAGATAGFLVAYNSTAAPAASAALTANLTLFVVPVAANGFAAIGGDSIPDRFGVGITFLFSTSTTTYSVPASAALFIRGKAA